MTYVTCPTLRYHPAVVAQKAATVGLLSDGRFTLGLGAGENDDPVEIGVAVPGRQSVEHLAPLADHLVATEPKAGLVEHRDSVRADTALPPSRDADGPRLRRLPARDTIRS
ncbi:LLM class flavin-dependent oxidoreductase [Krasilnikoviella flava]